MHDLSNKAHPQDTFEGMTTIAEAADLLKLSRSKLYELMDKGKIKYCKFDGARRIPRAELAAYIERNTHGGWSI